MSTKADEFWSPCSLHADRGVSFGRSTARPAPRFVSSSAVPLSGVIMNSVGTNFFCTTTQRVLESSSGHLKQTRPFCAVSFSDELPTTW